MYKDENIGKQFIVLFLFICFSERIYFRGIPPVIQHGMYILIPFMYFVHHSSWIYKRLCSLGISKKLRTSLILYFLALIWGMLVITIRDGEISYVFSRLLVGVWEPAVIYASLTVLIYRVLKPINLTHEFLKFYILSKCFCVLVSCLFVLYPTVKDWWMGLIFQSNLQEKILAGTLNFTRIGLKGFSNFGETIDCSIGVMFCLYLFDSSYRKLAVVMTIIMLLGNLFYGRSGLLLSLGMIIAYTIQHLSWKRSLLFLCLVCVLYGGMSLIFSFVEKNTQFSSNLQWAIQPFTTFWYSWERGYFSLGSSSDTMFRMYFVPDDDLTILMGDGKYMNSDGWSYYMHTDVGFMRHMLFYGLIGEALGYLSFIFLLLALAQLSQRTGDSRWRELALMFFLLTFYFEIKGDPFLNFFGIVFAICLGVGEQRRFCCCKSNRMNSGV